MFSANYIFLLNITYVFCSYYMSGVSSVCCGPFPVVQRYCNGLSCNGSGFDSLWERCKNQGSRPSQGTVKGGAVSK